MLDNVMLGGTADRPSELSSAPCSTCRARGGRSAACGTARCRAARRRAGAAGGGARRPAAAQRTALRGDRPRADGATPAFLLLDEPAAGLSPDEIDRLGGLVRAVAAAGTGVLLVEHHADLIFAVCDRVTVLNLGRILAAGTPGGDPGPPRGGGGVSWRLTCLLPAMLLRPSPLLDAPGCTPATARSPCCTAWTSTSAPARSWRCSARTAPASRRCCAPSPACCPRPAR